MSLNNKVLFEYVQNNDKIVLIIVYYSFSNIFVRGYLMSDLLFSKRLLSD